MYLIRKGDYFFAIWCFSVYQFFYTLVHLSRIGDNLHGADVMFALSTCSAHEIKFFHMKNYFASVFACSKRCGKACLQSFMYIIKSKLYLMAKLTIESP